MRYLMPGDISPLPSYVGRDGPCVTKKKPGLQIAGRALILF